MTTARIGLLICLMAGVGSLSRSAILHAADDVEAGVEIASDQVEGAPPPAVVREIERIRRDLGGPAVDHYPRLRTPPGQDAPRKPESGQRTLNGRKIEALRRTASDLDERSNRLESLELYEQADGMRRLAQMFRLEARRLASPSGERAEGAGLSHSQPPSPPLARIAETIGSGTKDEAANPRPEPEEPPHHAPAAVVPGGLPD